MPEAGLEVIRRRVAAINWWNRLNRLVRRAARLHKIKGHAADHLGKISTAYLH